MALSSAIVTGDFPDQEEYFGVSSEVIALTVSLTVCGFGYVKSCRRQMNFSASVIYRADSVKFSDQDRSLIMVTTFGTARSTMALGYTDCHLHHLQHSMCSCSQYWMPSCFSISLWILWLCTSYPSWWYDCRCLGS